MAEVIHRYIGRDGDAPARKQSKSEQEREELDAQWRRKRIAAEGAKQRLHEAKLLAMRGELISRQHVTKQMTFLAISMRQHLLAISTNERHKQTRSTHWSTRSLEVPSRSPCGGATAHDEQRRDR